MGVGWLEVRVALGGGGALVLATGVLQEALAEKGYAGFAEEDEGVLVGYVQQSRYSEGELRSALREFGVDAPVEVRELPSKNWNAEWESKVAPVMLRGKKRSLRVRAAFHAAEADDVIVTPRMAFGTGHHATTALEAEALLDAEIEGKRVLDMGCGTGLLALVAVRCGAASVDAIDYDEEAVRNALENVKANGAESAVRVIEGGFDAIPRGAKYDWIAANLTLNLVTAHMATLRLHLQPQRGVLAVSGLLARDVNTLAESARREGMRLESQRTRDGWALCIFRREESQCVE